MPQTESQRQDAVSCVSPTCANLELPFKLKSLLVVKFHTLESAVGLQKIMGIIVNKCSLIMSAAVNTRQMITPMRISLEKFTEYQLFQKNFERNGYVKIVFSKKVTMGLWDGTGKCLSINTIYKKQIGNSEVHMIGEKCIAIIRLCINVFDTSESPIMRKWITGTGKLQPA